MKEYSIEEGGGIALAFECSKEEELRILDAIRSLMIGKYTKTEGYINSSRWVIKSDMIDKS